MTINTQMKDGNYLITITNERLVFKDPAHFKKVNNMLMTLKNRYGEESTNRGGRKKKAPEQTTQEPLSDEESRA